MIFVSYSFLFLFLPFVLIGYGYLSRFAPQRVVLTWLILASFVYYAWTALWATGILGASLVVNYAIAGRIARHVTPLGRRTWLIVGLTGNLALLCYFKYANFFVGTASTLLGTSWSLQHVVLPLGISFFTFQKIAYLVDAYTDRSYEPDFLRFVLFVMFFPQLIAGPIVHHKEVMPQFATMRFGLTAERLAVGGTLFSLGLAKKLLLADTMSPFADRAFDLAASHGNLMFADAWLGALAYTFQIYFDFSGYSDMAIGMSMMFGIVMPLNFYSPYKAGSIIEFWRRWHMTLSRFLRDYLYIPLGGNRRGKTQRYVNLIATMLLGGLWHGAGFTFIVWGLLHGIYLCVNHAWLYARPAPWNGESRSARFFAHALTFLSVVIAWVFFRASNLESAFRVVGSMLGMHGFDLGALLPKPELLPLLFLAGGIAFFCPNTCEIVSPHAVQSPHVQLPEIALANEGSRGLRWIRFEPSRRWAWLIFATTLVAVAQLSKTSAFIYYQF